MITQFGQTRQINLQKLTLPILKDLRVGRIIDISKKTFVKPPFAVSSNIPLANPPQKKLGCNCGKKAAGSSAISPTIVKMPSPSLNVKSPTVEEKKDAPVVYFPINNEEKEKEKENENLPMDQINQQLLAAQSQLSKQRSQLTKPVDFLIAGSGTKVWGNATWEYLHTQAYYYHPSEEEKIRKLSLFKSIIENIPCQTCKRETNTWLVDHPLEKVMDDNSTLSKWVLDLHNYVNKGLGRAQWEMKQVVQHYNFPSTF